MGIWSGRDCKYLIQSLHVTNKGIKALRDDVICLQQVDGKTGMKTWVSRLSAQGFLHYTFTAIIFHLQEQVSQP